MADPKDGSPIQFLPLGSSGAPRRSASVSPIDQPLPNSAEDEPWVEAWRGVLHDLDNEDLHARFLAIAARHNRLPYALDAYRRLQGMRAGDPRIAERIAHVGRMMAVVGGVVRVADGPRVKGQGLRAVWWWTIALLAALLFTAVAVTVRRSVGE